MCDRCDYEEYLDFCDNLLEDGSYDFAVDTIEGIKEWIKENEHVTDKQKKALQNIEDSV